MDLKDVLFESNNEFEIPNLLLDKQAGKLELPFAGYGSNSRLKKISQHIIFMLKIIVLKIFGKIR